MQTSCKERIIQLQANQGFLGFGCNFFLALNLLILFEQVDFILLVFCFYSKNTLNVFKV